MAPPRGRDTNLIRSARALPRYEQLIEEGRQKRKERGFKANGPITGGKGAAYAVVAREFGLTNYSSLSKLVTIKKRFPHLIPEVEAGRVNEGDIKRILEIGRAGWFAARRADSGNVYERLAVVAAEAEALLEPSRALSPNDAGPCLPSLYVLERVVAKMIADLEFRSRKAKI